MTSGIDRASFLALTFGIAACNTGPGPAVAAIEIPVQPPQPDAGRAPEPAAKPEPSAPKPVAISEPSAEGDDDDDEIPYPVAEGGVVGGSIVTNYKGCGFVDPATVTRPAAGSCSDDKGTVVACTPTCSGFAFPRQKCESYRKFLKPKVAAAAVACIAKLSGKEQCDACKIYRCGDLAMKGSCPDPSADAACKAITGKCPSVAMADCQRYMSGLNAAGRAQLTQCLTSKSGCGFGIFSCAEGLF